MDLRGLFCSSWGNMGIDNLLPSTMHASHCLYWLGWIQWCVTRDTVADCLLVAKPPVGSGPLCIMAGLAYYYSWEKILLGYCVDASAFIQTVGETEAFFTGVSWLELSRTTDGQQESARTLEWLAYVPSRSEHRGAGQMPRSWPSCLCMDLLRPPKVWTRHVSNYFEVERLDISEKCFCCCCQCYIVMYLCQIQKEMHQHIPT